MRSIPLDIDPIHFVGIGGIGMSGIAEILHNLNYKVQGSDIADNPNVQRLRGMGIDVVVGHAEDNVEAAGVVVVSTAVKADNPEVRAARARLIPVVRRAEMLAELMRLKWSIAVGGTHGKTTTTSLIAAVLETANMDPTVINGGIINALGTNAKLGSGQWMVCEADESDGTFLRLPAAIAVITNIDPEHLDHYGSFDDLRQAFVTFVENLPFYGFAALCIDHSEVQALIPKISDRRIVTYGLSSQADVRAENIQGNATGTIFDVVIADRKGGQDQRFAGLTLAMHGLHNVQNALAAIAIAAELGIEEDVLNRAFTNFEGVKRRFTRTGEVDGVSVIDDYGHHPVEIAAVLQAARDVAQGKVVAVVQPHRYTRLRDLFEDFCSCFNDADAVIVADVYAAGEAPIDGYDKDSLVDGLRARGHRRAMALPGPDALPALVRDTTQSGDLVVCLGAGNITAWANALPGQLREMARDTGGGT